LSLKIIFPFSADELFWIFAAAYEKMRKVNPDDYYKLKQVEELWGFEKRRLMREVDSAQIKEERARERSKMSDEQRQLDDANCRQEALAELDDFIKEIEMKLEQFISFSIQNSGIVKLGFKVENILNTITTFPCKIKRFTERNFLSSDFVKQILI
jgi:hypothetical protein